MPDIAPDFVYVTFIAADRETVWNGLIDREVTKHYWGHFNESDWEPGSRWEHVRSDGSGKVDTLGKVVEIDPPKRLVITWVFAKDEGNAEQTSCVTFELEALGPDTRLTVTHSDLIEGSEMHTGVTAGWPAVLSNLKTYLETGKVLSEEKWGQE